jgi:fatty-acid desaturase
MTVVVNIHIFFSVNSVGHVAGNSYLGRLHSQLNGLTSILTARSYLSSSQTQE